MSIKLSHSSKSTFLACGEKYRLHYLERWRPISLSSALVFGSAIDHALNFMLGASKGNPATLDMALLAFNQSWEQGQNSNREVVDMPLNPNLEYSRYDWDADLLDKPDWRELFKYDANFFDTKNKVDEMLKEQKKEWHEVPEEMRMVVNYGTWLCMQKKGEILLKAYYEQILPQIKDVLAVQMDVELDDGNGNILNGVIDAVVRLQDGRVIILDNKTTSTEYDEDSVRGSEQLATYKAILNIFNDDPDHSWKHRIDGAGYAVMSKKLIKDITKTCKSCGHVATGAHKTCDNHIDGKRCNGEWDKVKKFAVKTQFITGDISEEYAAEVLENATTVKSCIEQGLFPKNYSACDNMFGRKCPYFNKCHGGDTTGLIKLESK